MRQTPSPLTDPRAFLGALFSAALAAADPQERTNAFLRAHDLARSAARTVVVGAGKAAAAMAQAVERAWPADCPLDGLVVTRYGHGVPTRWIEVVEAGHPLPDAASQEAAVRVLELARRLSAADQLVCLLSGGGSALLALPAAGLSLSDKRAVTDALLRAGATIAETNCVRKHLSAIKGGRLAAAAFPARTLTLAISDVPNDDPSVIASGPTVADPTSFAEARAVLDRYRIDAPERVRRHLESGRDETPKPGDPRLARTEFHIVARPRDALQAAAEAAQAVGVTPLVLGDSIQGEARAVAEAQAAMARQVARWGGPVKPPAVLLSSGETTVTVRGPGRGGPNTEFVLTLAISLAGQPGVYALAADTDGLDGSGDNAGAVIDPNTLDRALAAGLDARAALAANDAHSFFHRLGDLLTTGPTRTNVNDFRAILVLPQPV